MKPPRISVLLILVLTIVSCNRPSANSEAEKAEEYSKDIRSQVTSTDSTVEASKQTVPQRSYETHYVNKKTGIDYSGSPKGKTLGKIPLNSKVKVFNRAKTRDTLETAEDSLKGEWSEIEYRDDTVYVLSASLTGQYSYSDIEVFYFSMPVHRDGDDFREAFVNLSESDRLNNHAIQELDFGENPVRFDRNQKNQILSFTPNDTVYIFSLIEDSIIKFAIEDLPLVAYVHPYFKNENTLSAYHYIFGLSLGKKYAVDGEAFTYIGQENPFKTGEVEAIKLNKVDNDSFPVHSNYERSTHEIVTFLFTTENLKYFIQKTVRGCSFDLVIVDDISHSVIYYRHYQQSESIAVPCIMGPEYSYGWTGKVFKNKPPIIYGLESHKFGCPSIDFLGENEPPIEILCDNRH